MSVADRSARRCEGKIPHDTEDGANLHILELWAVIETVQERRALRAYRCGDHWHVGHRKGWKKS